MNRDYSAVMIPGDAVREARMRSLVDSLWRALSPQGVSWVGFYFGPGERLDDGRVVGPDEMLLGPCRDKPACSPIGLHGVCGRGWRELRPIIVRDVASLGPNYVACDPRDRSEIVVPMIDDSGRCTGVLDLDSFEVGSFDRTDAEQLTRVLIECGLTDRLHSPPGAEPIAL